MNIRTDIICSESNIDLKDKIAMGENSTPLPSADNQSTEIISEKTIADLFVKSVLMDNGSGNLIHSATVCTGPKDFDVSAVLTTVAALADYCYESQVLGREWVIPNSTIQQEILSGNEPSYIHTHCSLKTPDTTILVLCEVRKDYWSDGSYRIKYHPLTYSQLKRMPE
jgi:hypothetical protein